MDDSGNPAFQNIPILHSLEDLGLSVAQPSILHLLDVLKGANAHGAHMDRTMPYGKHSLDIQLWHS